jgi:hypothetical protein
VAIGPGWVLLETERTTTEIQAFINGKISRVLSNIGVIVEANGAIIEAACGFGGEAYGRLKRLVNSPFEMLEAEAIGEDVSGSIILGGRTVDEETLRQAETWQVRGIIVGSIQASLLNLDPPTKVRVVATEGFGDVPMSAYTFGVLTSLSRREISIRGQTPNLTRAPGGGLSEDPPIILAADASSIKASSYTTLPTSTGQPEKQEITVGSRVRVIQGKSLGASGIIDSLPPEPQPTETGIVAPGAYVNFNNEIHYVPWTNLEQVN